MTNEITKQRWQISVTLSSISPYFEVPESLYFYRENQVLALIPSAQEAIEIRAIQPHASG